MNLGRKNHQNRYGYAMAYIRVAEMSEIRQAYIRKAAFTQQTLCILWEHQCALDRRMLCYAIKRYAIKRCML